VGTSGLSAETAAKGEITIHVFVFNFDGLIERTVEVNYFCQAQRHCLYYPLCASSVLF